MGKETEGAFRMTREYRILISHRYSARWANRVNKHEYFDETGTLTDTDHIVVDDAMIVCDLCNTNFPENYDAEIPILQHKWAPDEPWTDVGTRCPGCLEGLEDVPRIREGVEVRK